MPNSDQIIQIGELVIDNTEIIMYYRLIRKIIMYPNIWLVLIVLSIILALVLIESRDLVVMVRAQEANRTR